MSGLCIDKLPHSCGTKKGLQVFADSETNKVTGFCFSCQTFIANPYGVEKTADQIELPKPKTEAEIQAEIAEVDGYPIVDIKQRRLRAKYLKEFGIKVSLSEEDGVTPTAMYFPIQTKDKKTTGYYVKTLSNPYYQWSIGEVKHAYPFGWEQARKSGAYKLIICEGREDAVAVTAIMDMYGEDKFKPAVISLTNGVYSVKGNLSLIAEEASNLFKEIVICFDDDEPGQKAVMDAMLIFPKALSVTLPEKDANDCLIRGAGKAAYKALAYQAKTPKNTRLVLADEALHASAREPTPRGELTWPFPTLEKLLRGIRYGETIYIGSGVKMGKSELVNFLAEHFVTKHGVKVLLAKPEEVNKKTYKMMANKVVGHVFTDPEIEFDYQLFDKAGEKLRGNVYLLDLYQHIGWETLRQDIVAAASLGVKAVFIDPITNLVAGMDSASANTKLEEIAKSLSALALDLNIVIFLFCHLKAHDGNISQDVRLKKYRDNQYVHLGNCPHEFGGDVLSTQFAGSRAMMRSCNLMIGLEGNKDSTLDSDIRHLRWLTILEDREFGNSASVCIYWNDKTTRYKEV